nr:phosphorylase [uncultured Coprococcus sp.]
MAEALEKWPVNYLAQLCPRVYMIIEEINRRAILALRAKHIPESTIQNVSIIKDGMVRMCNMAVTVAFSVNGVASLHTQILERETFHDFYTLTPEKFNNKTNGITHRRFLLAANPGLASLLEEKIGDNFITDPVNGFKRFLDFSRTIPTL